MRKLLQNVAGFFAANTELTEDIKKENIMSDKLVITIERQYGSGGRDVGHALAELLGCKCYDQDLIFMAAQRSGISESEAKDRIAKKDKKRANYYNYYTGGKWGKPENYDLVVSTSNVGIEGAARIIYEYAKTAF